MYAVIMAGGEGRRLRPISSDRPKPLVNVAGRPAMSRIIELLSKHGIKNAAVTTHYRAKDIENYYNNSYEGVNLKYFRENTPLGTAGSVRNTLPFLMQDSADDSFIVISGDAVCELDISRAISYHRRKEADVTIVLSRTRDTGEYGVVECDDNGMIKRFIEKPSPAQSFSDTVNTGIYIIKRSVMEELEEGRNYDFGRDIFPDLLSRNKRLYGICDDAYWCDIGSAGAYYDCNIRLALAASSTDSHGNVVNGVCVISSSADIRECVIGDGVVIEGECSAYRAIICDGVRLCKGSSVGEGCVIGHDCKIESKAHIESGAKIMENIEIGKGAIVMGGTIFGDVSAKLFKNGGISVKEELLSGEYALRLGRAVASAYKDGKIGLMYADDVREKLICDTLSCGIRCMGASAYELKTLNGAFKSLAAFSARNYGFDALLFVEIVGDYAEINVYDKNGLYPTRTFERSLSSYLAIGGKEEKNGHQKIRDNTEEDYVKSVLDYVDNSDDLSGVQVKVSGEKKVKTVLLKVLSEMGVTVFDESSDERADAKIKIDRDGRGVSLYGSDGTMLADFYHIVAAIVKSNASKIKQIAFANEMPEAIAGMAEKCGIEVSRYSSCPCDEKESDIRSVAAEHPFVTDGIYASAMLCILMKQGIKELFEGIDRFETVSYDIDAEYIPLLELGKSSIEGVFNEYRTGSVKIVPRNGGYKIYAESKSAIEAQKLASMAVEEIKSKQKEKDSSLELLGKL
jgi:mannose-1-phosphate guanylyltransferase/phosphomannomutase